MFHKARLATLIAERALQIGEFTLTSGQKSNFYLDLSKITLDPEGLTLVCKCFWELMQTFDWPPDAVSGPSAGADPIIGALTLQSYAFGMDVKGLMVRSKPKEYGDQGLIEGPIRKEMRVVVVDDVVTTGGSVKKTIKALNEAGCYPISVLSIVDREGGAFFRSVASDHDYDIPYYPLFKLSDLALSHSMLKSLCTSPCSNQLLQP